MKDPWVPSTINLRTANTAKRWKCISLTLLIFSFATLVLCIFLRMRDKHGRPQTTVLLIALAFENCVDLAHAPLAFLYSDFVWGLCGSKVTRKTQPFKRKCNQQYKNIVEAKVLV